MASGANSTIIPVIGGGGVSTKDIAAATANGGLTVFETSGDIYVTDVKQEFRNQKLITQLVTENNNVTTYQVAGNYVTNYAQGAAGQLQFSNGAGSFDTSSDLTYNKATRVLTNTGNIDIIGVTGIPGVLNVGVSTTIADTTNSIIGGNLRVISDLEVVGQSNLLSNTTIGNSTASAELTVYGNLTTGNTTIGNVGNIRNLSVAGNITSSDANLGNLLIANYVQGTLTTASQPNITSISNTLSVGNVTIIGNTTAISSVQTAANALSLVVASRSLTLQNDGNIVLPQTSNGISVLTDGNLSANGIVIASGSANYSFDHNGKLTANVLSANILSGSIGANSNAQPNITSIGSLTTLTVANSGTGNITADNINAGNLLVANTIGNTTAKLIGANATLTDLYVSNTINASNIYIEATATIVSDLTVSGNMHVDGTTTYINTTQLAIEDPIITLGGTANGAAANVAGDRGIVLQNYNLSNTTAYSSYMGWNSNVGEFAFLSEVGSSTTNTMIDFSTALYGNIRANLFKGNFVGNFSGNIISANSSVTVATDGDVMLTSSNGTLGSSLTVNTTGFTSTGNANIAGNLTSNNSTTSNTLTAGNITVSGSITGTIANGTSNIVTTANSISLSANSQANILVLSKNGSVGQANVTGLLNVTSNVTAPNFVGSLSNGNSNISITSSNNTIIAYANANAVLTITSAAVAATVDVTTSGNMTANYYNGNGSHLANITGANITGWVPNANIANTAYSVAGANVTGEVANAAYANLVGSATTAQTVTASAQSNITSVGTLTSLSVTGNISGNVFTGNANGLSHIVAANIVGNVANATFAANSGEANIANYATIAYHIDNGNGDQGNITSVGTLTSLSVEGTITVNTGNITATAGIFNGNGSGLTQLTGSNVTGTVGSATTAGTVTTASQGNITSLGTLTGLGVNGTITASDITANTGVFTGNGAALTNLNIANINNALKFTGPVTNNGVALDAANVGTIDITINGTTYTLYAVPKP